mmetsp:Transcript_29710/g.97190  ORF Transcript_29710/g.97190 Transcript_29710/m.97190 type:complete len:362 (+) Transcript_29710:273-1358(+)
MHVQFSVSMSHVPCPLHMLGQLGGTWWSRISHASPSYMSSQAHVPLSWHLPCPLQSSGHRFLLHAAPWNGSTHSHRPVSRLHSPFPLHSSGHCTSSSHSSPRHPVSHSHSSSDVHRPCSPHPGSHVRLQAAPYHVLSHVHSPLSWSHLPCPLQCAGHVGASHPRPRHPSAQTHSPSSHTPCPLQLCGQNLAQMGPKKPSSHTHSPSSHSPWSEQPSGQVVLRASSSTTSTLPYVSVSRRPPPKMSTSVRRLPASLRGSTTDVASSRALGGCDPRTACVFSQDHSPPFTASTAMSLWHVFDGYEQPPNTASSTRPGSSTALMSSRGDGLLSVPRTTGTDHSKPAPSPPSGAAMSSTCTSDSD